MSIYKSNYRGKRHGYRSRTWKNKLGAVALLALSTAPIFIDGDATALVFMACFAVPMFFSKNDWFL